MQSAEKVYSNYASPNCRFMKTNVYLAFKTLHIHKKYRVIEK